MRGSAVAYEIDGGVVEVTPVAVLVGARKDGLAVGESVLGVVLVMAQLACVTLASPHVSRSPQ
jgi:hypothetical protein